MYDVTVKRQNDYARVRDQLRTAMDALDLLVEPLAAVHVNLALEIILAKMPVD